VLLTNSVSLLQTNCLLFATSELFSSFSALDVEKIHYRALRATIDFSTGVHSAKGFFDG